MKQSENLLNSIMVVIGLSFAFFFYFYSFSVLCVMRVTIKQTEDIFIQECSVRSVEIVLYRFTRAPFSRMLDQR